MLSLLNDRYSAGPAFMSTNAASLAVIHVCLEKSVFALLYASFRAKHVADAALNAFRVVPHRPLRPPAARMVFTGAARL